MNYLYIINGMNTLGELQDIGFIRSANASIIENYAMKVAQDYVIVADAVINRDLPKSRTDITKIQTEQKEIARKIKEIASTEIEKLSADNFNNKYEKYIESMNRQLIYLEKNSNPDNAIIKSNDDGIDELRSECDNALEPIRKSFSDKNKEDDAHFDDVMKISKTTSMIIFGIAILCVLIISYIVTKAINSPIQLLESAAKKVAEGDVSVSVDVKSKDELGKLSLAFNAMVKNINDSLDSVHQKSIEAENSALVAENIKNESLNQQAYLQKSVALMLDDMSKFADGDLTVELTVEKNDDIGKLFQGFNTAVERIRSMMQQVSSAVESTASATAQISASTEEMSRSSEQQLHQTLEVASGMEEMTQTILENTRNASSAATSAQKVGISAEHSWQAMNETINGMNRIAEVIENAAFTVKTLGDNSDKIGEIVQVIEDIANQTNLLALNAAIEAARAGEQGRGFAVVADEVRKLAERTSKATTEISKMIKQIQRDTNTAVVSMEKGTDEVRQGKQLADKAGEEYKEIISQVNNVVEIISQVAVASEEQSKTSEDIARNMENISSITKEGSDATLQIAHSAEGLNSLTTNLMELLNQFNVDTQKHSYNKLKRKNNRLGA